MTWREIKQAVEDAGVSDDDEIGLIQCENQQRFSLDRGQRPAYAEISGSKVLTRTSSQSQLVGNMMV